jgi:putative acyl-CoA dehydrogenase
MKNTLADMALEWEAALLLGLRLAEAVDNEQQSPHDRHLLRVGVPIAKYWNCRRANHLVVEALECHGGMGYVEEQPIAKLMREAPLNSVWEGTSAMMGLDFARALQSHPETRRALFVEIDAGSAGDQRLKAFAAGLKDEIDRASNNLEPHARRLMSKAATAIQASLLRRYAPTEVADMFVASRLDQAGTAELGTLPGASEVLERVTQRAVPG